MGVCVWKSVCLEVLVLLSSPRSCRLFLKQNWNYVADLKLSWDSLSLLHCPNVNISAFYIIINVIVQL